METQNLNFVETLKNLGAQEDLTQIGRELNELKAQFEDYILEEERKHQVAQLNQQESGVELEDSPEIIALKEEFYVVFNELKEKRKALVAAKKAVQAENLAKKKALIQQFKDVVAQEENIGAAFSAHKEINDKWKAIGDIPREERHDIQQEYSRLLEEFFYNIRIYKEIKDYDFKRNQDLKEAIIHQLKELDKETSIKEVENKLKALQNEWEDIGPTVQEEWERLKEAYWTSVKAIYDRIRSHYEERREEMQENIERKKGLIVQVEQLLANQRDSVKAWNNDTKSLLKIQEEWKQIGFGPRKENDAVWKVFRGLCDQFFAAKSTFFESAQEDFDKVAEQKEKLITEAEQLKDPTDWKEASNRIIQLQKRWKGLGNAGQRNEQRLWKKFRALCDDFFQAKKNQFAELDQANEDNLVKKQTLIQEIQAFQLPEDKKAALAALKQFAQSFAELGHVPLAKKNEIYDAYKKALDKLYGQLKLEGTEKETIMFEAKLDTMKGSGNAPHLLDKERQAIRKQIDEIKQNIIQYENNLGFFANSKGSNKLKEQVEKNIEQDRAKIEALKAKLKMIPNE